MTTTASKLRQGNRLWLALASVITANVLLVLSAKIQVPFWPVPMTMQTLVVVALGLGLGLRLGTAALVLYLFEGAIGLPVFAGTPERGIGLVYMAGPTGGYLAGFVACTIVIGWLAERGVLRNWPALVAAVLGGHALILACGALWLGTVAGWQVAWTAGTVPFLFGTLIKSALGVLAGEPLAQLRGKLAGPLA